MQKSSDGSNNFDEARPGGPRTDPVVGDADNVQKTSYVTGQGTDPDAPDPRGPAATTRAGSGMSPLVWLILIVALAIAAFYGIGLFR